MPFGKSYKVKRQRPWNNRTVPKTTAHDPHRKQLAMSLRRVDDLDGTTIKSVKNIHFSLDGVDYEIDLSRKHADLLRKTLSRYKKHARNISKEEVVSSANQLIRNWAQENGYEIAPVGKIPAKVMAAFQAANPQPPT